jgi:hypothetical protein
LADHFLRQRRADHRDGNGALPDAGAATNAAQAPEGRRLGRHPHHGDRAVGFQTLLEEGNKDDWFSSPFILRLALVAVVSLSLFVWIELTAEKLCVPKTLSELMT